MSGYTRQQSYIDGDTILAEHTNDEFDLLAEVFSTSLGHKHDGSTAEGPTIDLLSDDTGLTKVTVEETAAEGTIHFRTNSVDRFNIVSSGDITALSDMYFSSAATFNSTVNVSGTTTFTSRPMFNGGTSGVDSPFIVDSTFVVSNLNADLLDGVQGSSFVRSDTADSVDGVLTFTVSPVLNNNIYLQSKNTVGTAYNTIGVDASDVLQIGGVFNTQINSNGPLTLYTGAIQRLSVDGSGNVAFINGGTFTFNGNTIWHAGNDGASSGLDADLLDGVQGSLYARTDQTNTFTANNNAFTSSFPLVLLRDTDAVTPETVGGDLVFEDSLGVDAGSLGFNSSNGEFRLVNRCTGGPLEFYTENNEKMRIASSGNVGIGKTAPTYKLHLYSTYTEGGVFLEDSNTSQPSPAVRVQGKRVDGNTSKSFSGRLILEHSRSDAPMNSNVPSGTILFGGNYNTSGGIAYSSSISSIATGDWLDNVAAPSALILCTSNGAGDTDLSSSTATYGTERMRIDADGNVGIGTSSFSSRLHINNSSAQCDLRVSSGAGIATLTMAASGTNSAFLLLTNGTGERARIYADNSGNVSTQTTGGNIVFRDNSSGEYGRFDTSGNFLVSTTNSNPSPNNVDGISLRADGLISGGNTDSQALDISRNNTDGFIAVFRKAGVNVGNVSVTTSATSYNTSSDYRLKTNVVDLTNASDRMKALPVRRFEFKSNPGVTVDGFLAHEAQAIVPESVTGEKDAVDENGDPVYQVIDQSKLVPLLAAALKEEIAKREALEERLAVMEKDVLTFDKRLAALENK